MLVKYFIAAFLLLHISAGTPIPSTTEALVVVSEEAKPEKDHNPVEPRPPKLKSMHVESNIRNRYARTVVTSKYANPESKAQQATFSIVLPDTAFISGFVMEINEKKYEAYVKEKEEAKKEYDQAVAQGLGAAHVAVNARDSNKFTVSVNIEPESKVIFNLTYEELLIRKNGKYEVVINLHPGQLIKDLGVDVHINETRPIINVETPALRSGNEITDHETRNEFATIDKNPNGVVHVSFHPTVEEQKKMAKLINKNSNEENGISGQFVIEYDVERDPTGGEVLVNDGYFVHFFSPSELKPIPKHIVFVLDVSGSMYGRKIEQLKDAMKVILGQLNPDDYFNLVKFHTDVQVLGLNNTWENVDNPQESPLPQGLAADADNIKNAQDIVSKMTDEGLTNIYDALIVGLRLTSKGLNFKVTDENKHKPQPIIIFLTDGQANVGESRSDKMIEMVETRNSKDNKAAVFALAFGDDASNDFLKELAIKNSGFSRKIYEGADAALQLQDFYKTISSPLLTDVNFKYAEDKVKEVTKHKFDILFRGGEFIVAGKVEGNADKFVEVEGLTVDGTNRFHPIIIPICPPKPEEKREYGSLERLWAYLTIKQLLDKKYEAKDSDKNATDVLTPEKKATQLALKYSFVTPVTSLIVVKPNETESSRPEQVQDPFDEPQDKIFGGGKTFMRAHSAAHYPRLGSGYSNIGSRGAMFSSRRGGHSGTLSRKPVPLNAGAPFAARPAGGYPTFALSGQPGLPGIPSQFGTFAQAESFDSFDSQVDALIAGPSFSLPPAPTFLPLSTTYRPHSTTHLLTTTTNLATTTTDDLQQPIWLELLISGPGKLAIDDKEYEIGNNGTSVEHKNCQVPSLNLSGNCTLLTACPRIYHKLDTFETYKTYFCPLESGKYAGVCCPGQDEE